MKGFVRGFLSPFRAAKLLIGRRGVKRYAILPLLCNIILFALFIFATLQWILPGVDLASYAPVWTGAFGQWVLTTFKWIIGVALLLVLFFYGFTAIGLVITSPLNDLLSEKVEGAIGGNTEQLELPWKKWLAATALSIWESLRIAIGQLLLTLICLPFMLIPIVGIIPIFVVNAYFAGLGFMDFSLARHFLRKKHRQAGLGGRRSEIFGLGVAMTLLLMIPGLGLCIMPLGVTAATILYCDIDWQGTFARAGIEPPPGYVPPVK